ncbi:3-phosphoshikimate 1-carboxyvinyltransferase [Devosia sp. 2618]|uniref:3-phosphoshikimate 1-carboxyvinyltransferase n=1 Tax=Devosia sp. 2618 TaxID=3156454 RepID=UPI00339B25CE
MTDIDSSPTPFASRGADPFIGRFATPGDKSISHRALILGALAVGQTSIEGLLESEDVLATANALRHFGVSIAGQDGNWRINGLGVGGLLEPQGALELGNSGTGLRLLMGLAAPYAFETQFTGGPTLARRPLGALTDALAQTGSTEVESAEGGLPLTLRGSATPLPIHHVMAKPSEQVKSALLLAGAQIAGTTTIVEPVPTRDHTEKMLAAFGVAISTLTDDAGVTTITLRGLTELRPTHIVVPGDPSSAAYALVAALIVAGSDLTIENVLVNPTRTGLIDTLLEMGGDIQFINQREIGGEHVADLRVRSSRMKGVRVDALHAGAMLDDIPALAIAAAFAQGETVIEGLAELREQECDRLAAIAAGLAANKVTVSEGDSTLTIGGIGKVDGGGMVESRGDHRIAMSFLVLGLASHHKVSVDDTNPIAASFPGFIDTMNSLGARIEPAKGR